LGLFKAKVILSGNLNVGCVQRGHVKVEGIFPNTAVV
jgi:hypothetical protein